MDLELKPYMTKFGGNDDEEWQKNGKNGKTQWS